MVRNSKSVDISKWTDVIFEADKELIQKNSEDPTDYKKKFVVPIAENLYADMRRARVLITAPFTFNKVFSRLPEEEKKIWYNYAESIPEKLRSLNLYIRPFNEYCATCIITDEDIEKLACLDHDIFSPAAFPEEITKGKTQKAGKKTALSQVSFKNLPGARKWFFKELNFLIPPQLKKIGYEIVRPEEVSEINPILIRKLARAIHSRYLQEMRTHDNGDARDLNNSVFHYPGDSGNQYLTDFENLPDDIKYSNKDNAFHIPTKLLSIGYKIRPVKKGFKAVTLHLNDAETETMASVEHIRWSWDKRLNGWIYGTVKDNLNKIHPGLIPYQELSESEKEKDRELVRLIPALLQDIDYEAYPVNPEKIRNLSYAIKPQSSIHKLLDETRQMNDEIRKLAASFPTLDEKIKDINRKIEETIRDVQGSYNYAQHIQQAFLPDHLYIRECFPDSFVLFKPKDIVSGDFYFFSKQTRLKIFAAADCTGHGIPGALLSTIGYGITDQAVNEIKLTDPGDILHHLYSRVHRFLRWDEDETGLSDAMDIILCVLDLETNMLTYSGVQNPLYRVTNGEIIVYPAQNSFENCNEKGECKFLSGEIQLNTGDTIYLCTDGYTDQFGGENHKRYKSNRFRSFLMSIQDYTMSEQSDKLYENIETWRDEYNEEQTDDILVIGIRI
jgi:serine phosphatase RsbU (regulator of sigma subunit)